MQLKQMRIRIAGRMKGSDRALIVMLWDKGSGSFLGQYLLHQKDAGEEIAGNTAPTRRSSLWFCYPPDYNVRRNAKQQSRIDPMELLGTTDVDFNDAKEHLLATLEVDAERRFSEFDVSKLMKKAA